MDRRTLGCPVWQGRPVWAGLGLVERVGWQWPAHLEVGVELGAEEWLGRLVWVALG